MSHGGQRWAHAKFVTIAAALLALMLALGPVMAASASTMHNELLATDPPYGAKLDAGPARVTLTFDLPAQRGFSTVIVNGPDRNQWQAGPATEDGTTVWAPVLPLGPAGEYTVAWRIISADGHSTHSTFPFTLTTPGTTAAAAPPSNPSGRATDAGSVVPHLWPWLAGACALLVFGVVIALTSRLRRGQS